MSFSEVLRQRREERDACVRQRAERDLCSSDHIQGFNAVVRQRRQQQVLVSSALSNLAHNAEDGAKHASQKEPIAAAKKPKEDDDDSKGNAAAETAATAKAETEEAARLKAEDAARVKADEAHRLKEEARTKALAEEAASSVDETKEITTQQHTTQMVGNSASLHEDAAAVDVSINSCRDEPHEEGGLRGRLAQRRAERGKDKNQWRAKLAEEDKHRQAAWAEQENVRAQSQAAENLERARDQEQRHKVMEEIAKRTRHLEAQLKATLEELPAQSGLRDKGFSVPESKAYGTLPFSKLALNKAVAAAKREAPHKEEPPLPRPDFGFGEGLRYDELVKQVHRCTRSSNDAQQLRATDERRWALFEASLGEIDAIEVPYPSNEEHVYADMPKDQFRMLALRWHPDRFEAKYGPRLCPAQHSSVMRSVKETFQRLNEARR